MIDDLVVQLFDATPRRETSLYLLLTGKKTLSILFSAMQHGQLNLLQLYPTLSRADFQASLARLQEAGTLAADDAGTRLLDPEVQAAAAKRLPLPSAYAPWMDLVGFGPKLTLAVQSLSEASFHNRGYRPAVADFGTQQAVRTWWVGVDQAAAIAALAELFQALPDSAADLLAQQFVGHDFVGRGIAQGLAGELALTQALAELVRQLDAQPQNVWARLWGGRKPLGSASQYQALRLAQAGMARSEIAKRLRLKPSTVNEHLLGAAIFGATFALEAVYPPGMRARFDALPEAAGDYHALLRVVPGSDFFQVRLYEILQFQGRWPR